MYLITFDIFWCFYRIWYILLIRFEPFLWKFSTFPTEFWTYYRLSRCAEIRAKFCCRFSCRKRFSKFCRCGTSKFLSVNFFGCARSGRTSHVIFHPSDEGPHFSIHSWRCSWGASNSPRRQTMKNFWRIFEFIWIKLNSCCLKMAAPYRIYSPNPGCITYCWWNRYGTDWELFPGIFSAQIEDDQFLLKSNFRIF